MLLKKETIDDVDVLYIDYVGAKIQELIRAATTKRNKEGWKLHNIVYFDTPNKCCCLHFKKVVSVPWEEETK